MNTILNSLCELHIISGMCVNNFWYNGSPQVLSKQVKYWRKEKRQCKTKSDDTNKTPYYFKTIFLITDSKQE